MAMPVRLVPGFVGYPAILVKPFYNHRHGGLGSEHSTPTFPLMLLDSIRSLFSSKPEGPQAGSLPTTPAVDPLHLAACVLLLDIAHADGEYSDAERAHLESVLERHFSLPPESGATLLNLAE